MLSLIVGLLVALGIFWITSTTGGDIGSTQTVMLATAGFFGGTIGMFLLFKFLVSTTAPKPARPREKYKKRPVARTRATEEELEAEFEKEIKEELEAEKVVTPPPRTSPRRPRKPPRKEEEEDEEEEEHWDAMEFDIA